MASAPLLGGTIEADDESPFPTGNIGEQPNARRERTTEPVVLVPGTTARNAEEGGIVSCPSALGVM